MIVRQFVLDGVDRVSRPRKRGAEETAKISAAGNRGEKIDPTDQTLAREGLKQTEAERGTSDAAARERNAHDRRVRVALAAHASLVQRRQLSPLQCGWIVILEGAWLRSVHGCFSDHRKGSDVFRHGRNAISLYTSRQPASSPGGVAQASPPSWWLRRLAAESSAGSQCNLDAGGHSRCRASPVRQSAGPGCENNSPLVR